jgi:hypothetical protein
MTPDRLIGLSEEEALSLCEHYNYTMRVVAEDGKYYIVTQDFRNDRINVYLMWNKVTAATIG